LSCAWGKHFCMSTNKKLQGLKWKIGAKARRKQK